MFRYPLGTQKELTLQILHFKVFSGCELRFKSHLPHEMLFRKELGNSGFSGFFLLIGTLVSNKLGEQEKLEIIEQEYNIPISNEFREEVITMCNLSDGIEERATERTKETIVLNMYKKGYSLEQIAEVTDIDVEAIETIIKKNDLVLV